MCAYYMRLRFQSNYLFVPTNVTDCSKRTLKRVWQRAFNQKIQLKVYRDGVGTLLMLPPLLLAVSRQMLDAKMEARTLCLLPRRTENRKETKTNLCFCFFEK